MSGGLFAPAGVLLAADPSSGEPHIDTSRFVDGLTAVLPGGMPLKAGKPDVVGMPVGVALLAGPMSGAALLGRRDPPRRIARAGLLVGGVAPVVRNCCGMRARI